MPEKKAAALTRRSLLLNGLMVVPLWHAARGLAVGPPESAAAKPPARDEFVEVDGWILRRSDIA